MENQTEKLIISKLDVIERELKEVRQKDVPELKTEMAVFKTEYRNKATVIAAVITTIGGVATLAAATMLK